MAYNLLVIVILSIVEGFTEFLPISSTGHMIIVKNLFNTTSLNKVFMDNFLVIVQLGAILAVICYSWERLSPFKESKKEVKKTLNLWLKIIVAVIPAVIFGLLLDDYISDYFLDNVYVVASSLIFYGLLLMIVEYYNYKHKEIDKVYYFKDLKYKTALIIGFFQCLAMVPGTSRSGATIIGALILGLSRPLATEFSFFLAIPTMLGATCLKLLKSGLVFTKVEWMYLGLGTIVAFMTAYIAIDWIMDFIKKRNFFIFGIYRILLGIIVLIYFSLK